MDSISFLFLVCKTTKKKQIYPWKIAIFMEIIGFTLDFNQKFAIFGLETTKKINFALEISHV